MAISVLYVFSCSHLMENIISIVDLLARKTNVTLDKFRAANTWKIFKATRPKSFFSDAEEWDASIVVAFSPVSLAFEWNYYVYVSHVLWYLPLHPAQADDFAELGEGIAFAAFQDFSWKTTLTESFSRCKRPQGFFHFLFSRFTIQLLQNRRA